jgi:polyisoprenyl-teichoic acid--peptidoglycan teichoic acid transferase
MSHDRWDQEGDGIDAARPRSGRGARRRDGDRTGFDPAPWSRRTSSAGSGAASTREGRAGLGGGAYGSGRGGAHAQPGGGSNDGRGYAIPGGRSSTGGNGRTGPLDDTAWSRGTGVWPDTRASGRGGSGEPWHVRNDDPSSTLRAGAGPRHARSAGSATRDGRIVRRPWRRSWPQRLVLCAGLVLVTVCMLGASVAGYALVKLNSIDRVSGLDSLESAPAGEPENYLIVAPDYRDGQETKNTDTIMVVRVDPRSDRLAITSFPRDLMVTVADTGETGQINAVYNRESGGERNLIDTLRLNYDIPIHHFIEVSFESFQRVVDAVGGVSVWLEQAVRDPDAALYSEARGCVNLDGENALAFVRSRKLEILVDGEWEHDPLSDVNRVQRQQIFIQRAMAKVLAQVKSNPLRVRELVDIGTSTVRLDPNLGISDILDLAERFQDFDAGKLEAYALPTVEYPSNPNRLLLDEAASEPMLNVFRGLAPGEIRPGLINVTVLNGTEADEAQRREGLATDVSGALQRVGFELSVPDDADTFYAHTTIEHAPGQAGHARRLAQYITSTTPIPLVENPQIEPGHVRLIAGADFTTVHDQPTPTESMPGAAPAPGGTSTTAAAGSGGGSGGGQPSTTNAAPTTTAPPPTTTTTENPFIIGQVPEGADC